jgi:predicted esterase
MAGIKTVVVHGRCDFVCQAHAAYRLSRALDPNEVRIKTSLLL